MRRAALLATLAAALGAALAAAALAATISGTDRANLLVGTPRADVVAARGGADRIAVQNGGRDTVTCGRGRDVVTADRADRVARDCEVVSRQISRDPYRNPESQHETQVEPDSFSFGSTIVTTFQTGRRFAGAAANIGYSTSTDGGRTWRDGFLPGLTTFSRPAGTHERASDPVVAYDAVHRVWLISTLAVSPRVTELPINRSTDGRTWSAPVSAARATTEALAYDKNWISCDNWPRSPFRGRCYLSYTDHQTRRPRLVVQTSTDGGLTWSAPVIAASPGGTAVGTQSVSRPSGELVIAYLGEGSIDAIESRDGGASFSAPVEVAPVRARDVPGIRAFPLPTADVDASGTIYVAWHDCRFQSGCRANDIVLSRSLPGTGWSAPVRIPGALPRVALDHWVPGIAADPATGGRSARLALVYHTSPTRPCDACTIDVRMVTSTNGGATWSRAQRLTARAMRRSEIARTSSGRMTGDYISVSYARGRAVPVFSLGAARVRGEYRQAIFATEPR